MPSLSRGDLGQSQATRPSPRSSTINNCGTSDTPTEQIRASTENADTISPHYSTPADQSGPRSRLDMSMYLELSSVQSTMTSPPLINHDKNSRTLVRPGDPSETDAHSGTALMSVSNNLLSLAEAEILLQSFFDHLNPMISLFDPILHTLDYLRSTSASLTSAILAMSAKFFRPDLHLPLLGHYHTTSSRALQADECSTALIQSLMVDVYWKQVKDVSAWRKIGAAIRMGYQMRWHISRTTALPGAEHDARVILVSFEP